MENSFTQNQSANIQAKEKASLQRNLSEAIYFLKKSKNDADTAYVNYKKYDERTTQVPKTKKARLKHAIQMEEELLKKLEEVLKEVELSNVTGKSSMPNGLDDLGRYTEPTGKSGMQGNTNITGKNV